jgi:hypothetical protein
VGDGVGDGLDGDEVDPQPTKSASRNVVPIIRETVMCLVLLTRVAQRWDRPRARHLLGN